MLFIKELKKICFSFIYVLFIGLLLFSWHENFYGVTTKEITGSQGNEVSISSGLTGGSILEKPEKNKESYGMKNKEVPDKIMCGGTDKLIMEYLANSYATYPFSYYKEVVLNENEQKEILNIIKEITGLNEQQINHLPDDYFPAVNGNVIHFGSNGTQSENGAFTFEMGNEEQPTENTDYTKQFVAQVSYEEFQELMNELIDCKQIGTTKLITIRFLAMLAAVLLPITILSFESLIPLIEFSAETGIAIDVFAFLKYIVWWLLPTAMIVTSSGMFLTILTSMPIAILVQFVWWFIDTSLTALSGDTKIFTLMIRHNLLRGSELIKQDFNLICLNRGLFVILSLILIALSVVVYNKKRGGKLNYDFFLQKHFGFFKDRFTAHIQK